MKAILFNLAILFGFVTLSSQVCLKATGRYQVRDAPCGKTTGQIADGETTQYRPNASPTTCTLNKRRYTFIPITKLRGWVASEGLEVCNRACVKVTADRLNVRNRACGTIKTSLARGAESRTTSTKLTVARCMGKNYLWVSITQGAAAADFLGACGGSRPPPPPPGKGKGKQRPTRIGQKGLDLIKSFEGKRNCWYLDPVGVPTICYGYANPPYKRGTCLSNAKCEELLRTKVVTYANCVRDAVKVSINQNQFDALTSFTYNIGCPGFRSSSVLSSLNRGRYRDVCAELKKFVKGGRPLRTIPGLVRRRNAECNLFNS